MTFSSDDDDVDDAALADDVNVMAGIGFGISDAPLPTRFLPFAAAAAVAAAVAVVAAGGTVAEAVAETVAAGARAL